MENNFLKIKDYFQDCNINFLIGSGASRPFLGTLGNIEKLLTELEQKSDLNSNQKKFLKFIIYKNYFDIAMKENLRLIDENKYNENDKELYETMEAYKNFIKTVNHILNKRAGPILNRQVNLFTTNIDIFLEKSLEEIGVEFNDGFYGRLKPKFDLSQYKRLRYNKSYFQDKLSESPVFNLLKIHGSINWIKENEFIYYDRNLGLIKDLKEIKIPDYLNYKLKKEDTVEILLNQIKVQNEANEKIINDFLETYEKIQIVNPTKQKFKDTVLKQIYYDILRIYANELEKENSVLIVFGFSFADEHIRSITVRALNSNPTLTMIVFAYTKEVEEDIKKEINKSNTTNNNILYLSPNDNTEEYNLKTINEKICYLKEDNIWKK